MNKAVASAKRRERDISKLKISKYYFERCSNPQEIIVDFQGPSDSFYQGGVWKLRVLLPDDYPFKSPSIGFVNKIFHPNIDFASGSICLDVINQTWSPMYELVNIFDSFLPQLLSYPNASDPLNIEAADLFNRSPKQYEEKVKKLVVEHASDSKSPIIQKPLHRASTSADDDDDKCHVMVEEDQLCEMEAENISCSSELSQLSETSDLDIEF